MVSLQTGAEPLALTLSPRLLKHCSVFLLFFRPPELAGDRHSTEHSLPGELTSYLDHFPGHETKQTASTAEESTLTPSTHHTTQQEAGVQGLDHTLINVRGRVARQQSSTPWQRAYFQKRIIIMCDHSVGAALPMR